MDLHLGEEFPRQTQSLMVDNHHSAADDPFDDVSSRTLFSFQTNRHISQGMIRFQGHERCQQICEQVLAESRFDLPDAKVDRYFERSFESVVEHLTRGPTSAPGELAPVGELNLKLAKKVRRRALSDPTAYHPEVFKEIADAFFPFPDTPLVHWPRMQDPDFAAGVTSRRAAKHALGA